MNIEPNHAAFSLYLAFHLFTNGEQSTISLAALGYGHGNSHCCSVIRIYPRVVMNSKNKGQAVFGVCEMRFQHLTIERLAQRVSSDETKAPDLAL